MFLLSGTIYCNAVDSYTVLHDVDNLSNHDPIILQLLLAMNVVCLASSLYVRRKYTVSQKNCANVFFALC